MDLCCFFGDLFMDLYFYECIKIKASSGQM